MAFPYDSCSAKINIPIPVFTMPPIPSPPLSAATTTTHAVCRVSQRLELLDGYLSEFDASGADTSSSQVQWQKKKSEPWKVTEEFPAGEDSKGKNRHIEVHLWFGLFIHLFLHSFIYSFIHYLRLPEGGIVKSQPWEYTLRCVGK